MAQFRTDQHRYLNNGNTIFEVVMLADQYGNRVGPSNPTGMAVDAFGRSRTSQPLTLGDYTNIDQMNPGFSTSNTAGSRYDYHANTSTVRMFVKAGSGQKVVRETDRVFSYQPGKSLQFFNTFVMNSAKVGLRQRVGYFNDNNGIFIEKANTAIRFVSRSRTTGTVVDTYAEQSNWNLDPLDGTGPSKITLDLDKAQILFTDIEWLGVGTVRCGFVINGLLIHCHSFHHANIDTDVYMKTPNLPVRYEIENISSASTESTLKQICSSIISEGGYELRGRNRSIGTAITTVRDLTTAGTFYPVVAIRLKSTNLDSIVAPKAVNLIGIGNNTRVQWRIYQGATIAGATWTSVGSDSYVEYNANNAATMSGGDVLSSGLLSITNQSVGTVELPPGLFKFQLERNGLTSTPTTFVLAAAGAANGDDAVGTIDWDEVS
jgi:hypothetical protein